MSFSEAFGKSIDPMNLIVEGANRRTVAPSLIVTMSFQLVIPGGLLSSRARFRFTNRGGLCEMRVVDGKN